ncbi:ChaB family protein [Bosea psychrotolerans]|uniref:ChaB family protein n=1 Tax=Bosea psychrotolerans TaxID=1871628 RepID=UPI000CDACB68
MPYASPADLPSMMRSHLPRQAQAIVRATLSHALTVHADEGLRKETAHGIAWAAIGRSDVRNGKRRAPATPIPEERRRG